MRSPAHAVLFGLVVAASLLPGDRGYADPHDHDAARLAVERGEIRPLAELLALVRDKLPGELAGVELERKHQRWMYEFHVVDKNGRLFEVYVDALTGDVRRTREK